MSTVVQAPGKTARTHQQRRRLYSYFRFSDRRQGKGTSIERQTAGAREYAQKHGYEFDEKLTMRDLGKSALRGKNAGPGSELGAFLAALENEQVPAGSVLYVESLDRLSRQKVLKAIAQMTLIIEHEVSIVTGVDGHEYSQTTIDENQGILFYAIGIMMRANNESEQKKVRAVDTINLKCRQWQEGKRVYVPAGINPSWVEYVKNEERWELVKAKADPIRAAIHYFREGNGGNAIIQKLQHKFGKVEGISNESRVYQIMRSRLLIGEKSVRQGGQTYVLKDYYPALLTVPEFESLQYLIDQRGRRAAPRGDFPNILTGMNVTYCGYCGRVIIAQNLQSRAHAGGWHRRFRCMGNTVAENRCEYATVKAPPIERALMQYCANQFNLSALLEGDDPAGDIGRQLASARAECVKLERKMKNNAKLGSDAEDDTELEFYRAEGREIARALKLKREEIAHLDRELANAQSVAVPAAADQWEKITHGVETLDHEDRLTARRLITETFKRINVYHRGWPVRDDAKVIVLELISRRDTSRVLEIDGKTGDLLRECIELDDLRKPVPVPVARRKRK